MMSRLKTGVSSFLQKRKISLLIMLCFTGISPKKHPNHPMLGNWRLPDNCAPYVIIYTGAQLSGSGAQLSGSGAQLSAILVCIPTYVISAPLCMYRSLEAPSKTSDTIFWVAVMRWFAAFLFRELKKVDFSSMRLSGAWLCGLEPWLKALLVSR